MGRQGESQNAGVLVVVVVFINLIFGMHGNCGKTLEAIEIQYRWSLIMCILTQ